MKTPDAPITRADLGEFRHVMADRMDAGFAAIRNDLRVVRNALVIGLIALVGIFLIMVAGFAAIIAKLYFGV